MGADSLMESFEYAARRHFADAEDLAGRRRLDNAGHLIGLAAECAVKHAIRQIVPNPRRIHFPELTAEVRKLGGRNSAVSQVRRALSPPAHAFVFDDWSIAMRLLRGRACRGRSVSEVEGGGGPDHECCEHRETVMSPPGESTVTFENALSTFAQLVSTRLGERALDEHRFVRDVDGRLTFLLLAPTNPEPVRSLDAETRHALGSYAAVPAVAVAADLLDPSLVDDFAVQELVDVAAPGNGPQWRRVAVVDRRIVGQDWAVGWQAPLPDVPPVLAFHSIKGGVGRSSAVAILAAHQAERGRNVLVVDLDLEAPGIGALLLAQEDLPQLGVLDWLVETSLRPDAEGELIQQCVGQSQLTQGRGAVDVLPALGRCAEEAPLDRRPEARPRLHRPPRPRSVAPSTHTPTGRSDLQRGAPPI